MSCGGQFNGLKGLIDAIVPVDAAVVEGVSTLPAGDPAWASVSVVGHVLRFFFAIPQGYDGQQGQPGADGAPGPQGPPFAQAVVDAVTTLPPEVGAEASVWFDGTDVHFSFGIPQGNPGGQGEQGQQGEQGVQGEPGPPGEVTMGQLNDAISLLTEAAVNSSANSNGVATYPDSALPEYDPAQMQAVIDKVNELILALRR